MSKVLIGGFAAIVAAATVGGVAFIATAEAAAKDEPSTYSAASAPTPRVTQVPEHQITGGADWEDNLRDEVDQFMATETDVESFCGEGLDFMELNTGEKWAALLEGSGAGTVSLDVALDSPGLEASLPDGVSTHEVFVAFGDAIVDHCDNL